jgi:hypothetical protein
MLTTENLGDVQRDGDRIADRFQAPSSAAASG